MYVEVNETNVIHEPSTTDLGSSFTVNLDAGDNLIRIRLAAKGSQPLAEVYDSDSFYYKVAETDFLVSNLGQTSETMPVRHGRFETYSRNAVHHRQQPQRIHSKQGQAAHIRSRRQRHPRGCDLLKRFGQSRRQPQDADQPRQHNRIHHITDRG